MDGGGSRDRFYGGGGIDLYVGGTGDDLFYARDGVAETISGGTGVDAAETDVNVALSRVESLL